MYSKSLTAGLVFSLLSTSIEAVALFGRPTSIAKRSNKLSCGIYILGFPAPKCNSNESFFAQIGSTNKGIIPLPWNIETTPLPLTMPEVKSIRYMGVTNETSCYASPPLYPTQYLFYDEKTRFLAAAYLTAGQTGRGCVDFNDVPVVSYRGTDMLVPMPEGRTGVGQ